MAALMSVWRFQVRRTLSRKVSAMGLILSLVLRLFAGVQDSSSSDVPPLRSPGVRACKPKYLGETETEGSMDEMEKPVADEPFAGIEE